MEKIENYSYKVSVAEYESAYYEAGFKGDETIYSRSTLLELGRFYSDWYCDYWMTVTFMLRTLKN